MLQSKFEASGFHITLGCARWVLLDKYSMARTTTVVNLQRALSNAWKILVRT